MAPNGETVRDQADEAAMRTMRLCLDEPLEGARIARHLRVTGWATGAAGMAVTVKTRLDGGAELEIPYGFPRPDVAAVFSAPQIGQCGFRGVLDVQSLDSGPHRLVVSVADNSGSTAEAGVNFEHDPSAVQVGFPDGHFYSPVVNPEEIFSREEQIWAAERQVLGVHFNRHAQHAFLVSELASAIPGFDYPRLPNQDEPPYHFYTNNFSFPLLDACALFAMLRRFRPKAMIEVGSGYSSLLTADVNRRFLDGSIDFTCIEPHPAPFLIGGVPGISRLVPKKVQEVPIVEFERLRAGDFLFIDSSHVSKTGSDVNYLVFEVIPRLQQGVVIHFHDIFLPGEYPKEWVLAEGRSWNEQYVVHALLMFTDAFEVLFGSAFASHYFPVLLTDLLGAEGTNGGSFWLQKTGPSPAQDSREKPTD